MEKQHQHKVKRLNIIGILVIVLLVVMVINVLLTLGVNRELLKNIEKGKEAEKPAEISLTLIRAASCQNCFNISSIENTVKNGNVKILNEETLNENDNKAKDYITKYNIQKLPTLLITGQVDKLNLNGFTSHGDTLEFNQQLPPYYDLTSKEVKGLVKVTVIEDSSCTDCQSLEQLINQFKTGGVVFSKEDVLDYKSASELISKYKIEKIPTLILSKDASVYNLISSSWNSVGSIESDGSYVFRNINPPYRDLKTNSIVGLVKVTYLADKSCTTCYDVKRHRTILLGMGLKLSVEENVDISDSKGKEVIKLYNIKKVPIIIMSKDASDYGNNFLKVWENVGSVENDGTFIFRNAEIMGTYKDLEKNEIVIPQPSG